MISPRLPWKDTQNGPLQFNTLLTLNSPSILQKYTPIELSADTYNHGAPTTSGLSDSSKHPIIYSPPQSFQPIREDPRLTSAPPSPRQPEYACQHRLLVTQGNSQFRCFFISAEQEAGYLRLTHIMPSNYCSLPEQIRPLTYLAQCIGVTWVSQEGRELKLNAGKINNKSMRHVNTPSDPWTEELNRLQSIFHWGIVQPPEKMNERDLQIPVQKNGQDILQREHSKWQDHMYYSIDVCG